MFDDLNMNVFDEKGNDVRVLGTVANRPLGGTVLRRMGTETDVTSKAVSEQSQQDRTHKVAAC
jgi:hypothetical protein